MRNHNYKTLVAFSVGQATAAQTLERLGTDSAEDLFLLKAQARLPMPRLPDSATQTMVQSLHQLPSAGLPAKLTAKLPAARLISKRRENAWQTGIKEAPNETSRLADRAIEGR